LLNAKTKEPSALVPTEGVKVSFFFFLKLSPEFDRVQSLE